MRRFLVGTVLAAVLVGSSACGVLEREAAVERPNQEQQGSAVLEIVDWGVVGGLLSVRVVNKSGRTLERARAVITIVRGNGVSVSAGGSVVDDKCCTVLSLPPEGHFGLYVDLGEQAEGIQEVRVGYADVSWSPPVDDALTTLDPKRVSLTRGESGTTVTSMVTTTDDLVQAAAGQAFLTGPDGEFLAVVSGRFSCFSPSRPRRVKMELFHPVPDGTTVESVVAYPLNDPTTTAGAGSCSG